MSAEKAYVFRDTLLQTQGIHKDVLKWMTYLGCSLSLAAEILCLLAFIRFTWVIRNIVFLASIKIWWMKENAGVWDKCVNNSLNKMLKIPVKNEGRLNLYLFEAILPTGSVPSVNKKWLKAAHLVAFYQRNTGNNGICAPKYSQFRLKAYSIERDCILSRLPVSLPVLLLVSYGDE